MPKRARRDHITKSFPKKPGFVLVPSGVPEAQVERREANARGPPSFPGRGPGPALPSSGTRSFL